MKKLFMSLLTMVAMATMAMVMTACGSDNDTDNDVEQIQSRNLYLVANPNELDCMNTEYVVKCGEQSVTVNVTNLKAVNVDPLSKLKDFLDVVDALDVPYEVYRYEMPASMKGEIKVYSNFSMKSDAPGKERYDPVLGAFYSEYFNGSGFVMDGLRPGRIEDYLQQRNNIVLITFTLK